MTTACNPFFVFFSDCDYRGKIDEAGGNCICKENVLDTLKCDTCKFGFWNLSINNPDGCQSKHALTFQK